MDVRKIADCWSSIRGLLEGYSTKDIKGILGRACVPLPPVPGTHKGPVLDAADLAISVLSNNDKERSIIACIEEIVVFEDEKNKNLLKFGQAQGTKVLDNLEKVLSRLGYGITGKDVFPLTLQLDLETASLTGEASEAIAEALRRYRDGRYAGAITSVSGAVDKITETIFLEKSLGDHKSVSFQERVSKAFTSLESAYCQPFAAKQMAPNEIKLIWENHRKAISQSAYVLGAFRRDYSDAHGEQRAPAEFVQKSLDCAVFILRSFIGVRR